MIQMPRALQFLPTQDENAASTLLRQEKGGGAPLGGGPLGGGGGGGKQPAASSKLLTTDRKALGNITNKKAPAAGGQPSGLKAAPKPAEGGRRTLGDLTNAPAAKQSAAKADALKPAPRLAAAPPLELRPAPQQAAAPPLQQQATPLQLQAAAAATALQLKADLFAQDGIEKSAGKGWAELERERGQRADLESRRRIQTFGTRRWGVHAAGQFAVADTCGSDDDEAGAAAEEVVAPCPVTAPMTLAKHHRRPPSTGVTPLRVARTQYVGSSTASSPWLAGGSPADALRALMPDLDFFAMLPMLSFGDDDEADGFVGGDC